MVALQPLSSPRPHLIRPAVASDAGVILRFIRELAEYEKLAHEVVATEQGVREQLFGSAPKAEALVAERDGAPVGFCLFFHNFSTFLARPGLYIEDLYVRPECRGQGIGKAFLQEVVRLAKERKCGRVEWSALDWNKPAIDFYKKLGAVTKDGWMGFRLTADKFEKVIEGKNA
jgi:GNAT superfamily N-acetyltransferase